MTPEQKRVVKSTILECRKILEADIEQVLINFGIYIDNPWVNVKSLQNISEEDENVRKKIEEVIKKLEKSGLSTAESVRQYIKEIVYTYVNRLSALRVLEVRGLIEEVLIPRKQWGDRSYGHLRFYEVAREYCKYQSDIGLAYFINLIFGEISEEIRVLFSTEDEYSLITPSSEALLSVIDLMCNQIEEDSWKQDEIIGWIYQYFNEKEKDDVFVRLYKKKQKIKAVDIPAATQLFTPDWIVKWIVDNSLGALWNEIKSGKREGKKLEDIRLLDPSCGSGHFLVQAYDLFYQLYLQEGYSKENIPYLILQNNLYGIDIDLRAIQLTALVLFIKVKTSLKENNYDTNTKNKLSVNLVCADAVLLNGTRLERLKNQFKKNLTISKMIDIIYDEFKDTRLKGSLIQPEKKLYPLFEEYKDKIAIKEFRKLKRVKKSQQQSIIETVDADSLEDYKSKRNWTKEEEELLGFLDLVYEEAIRANDITQQMFANEAVKSIKLVDVFMKEYDIVITNPPYMGRLNMNDKLKTYLSSNYKGSDIDLFSVFISRCIDFLATKGYTGMITQQSFMFLGSFKHLRKKILDTCTITNMVHLGPHAFDDISGQKVNTVMFTFQKNNAVGIGNYIRLVDYPNAVTKRSRLEQINSSFTEQDVYHISQNDFNVIDGSPFVYWIPKETKKVFSEFEQLDNRSEFPIAHSRKGLTTGDDTYFIRYHWEINSDLINNKWYFISKGEKYSKWVENFQKVVLWENDGLEIKNFKDEKGKLRSVLRNSSYYFEDGITYGMNSSLGFSARLKPNNVIISANGPGIFPKQVPLIYLLGVLNSNLCSHLLSILAPTITFNISDIDRIPIAIPNGDSLIEVENYVSRCIEISSVLRAYNETFYEFKKPLFTKFCNENNLKSCFNRCIEHIQTLRNQLKENELSINYKLCEIYDISYNVLSINKSDNDKLIFEYQNIKEFCLDLISYAIGCLFGRWQIDGLIPDDDGILPLDSSVYDDDIIRRLYDCIGVLFGDNNVDSIVEEIEQILEKRLDEWFIKEFFKEHIKGYQKRPIYWHICSPKKTFNCFVYYHKLDHDSLYKVKGIYLAEMINRYKEDLSYYRDQMLKERETKDTTKENEFKNRCNELELKLDDLNKLNKEIDKILPYSPDIDEGVLKNIMPLEPILSATVSNEKEREDNIEEDEEE